MIAASQRASIERETVLARIDLSGPREERFGWNTERVFVRSSDFSFLLSFLSSKKRAFDCYFVVEEPSRTVYSMMIQVLMY